MAKRLFDIAFASAALVCCLPIIIVAAILVRLESSGSPIFFQRRVGKENKLFSIIKLRTMYVGAEKFGFRTASNDGRLTKVGKWLRRLNVDELPQLFNIIRGEMSVIGPRPLSDEETNYIRESLTMSDEYPGLIPTFRPGLVGLEQVSRSRQLTYLERFKLNAEYEQRWSILLDQQIMLKAMVMCKEACLATILGGLMILAGMSIWLYAF
ncbi:MAG TPA: sugar transferase [Planktothrix sp.]